MRGEWKGRPSKIENRKRQRLALQKKITDSNSHAAITDLSGHLPIPSQFVTRKACSITEALPLLLWP